ncbi:MAG: hypothetical protein NVSMB57_10760 [Actinomycetota bacterium]
MSSAEIPPDVAALVRERDDARAAKDFARADEIRASLDSLGYDVRDSPAGGTAVLKPRYELIDPLQVSSTLDDPASLPVSIHVTYEGFRDDLDRVLGSFNEHCAGFEIVIADAASDDRDWLESKTAGNVRVLHFSRDPGWAAIRNAAMKQSRGEIIAIADLSVEATGDLLTPLVKAFDDPRVGVAGPWGLATKNLQDFEAASSGRVDAIEGYFLATRRSIARRELFDDKFRWYRHADIEYSFRIRDLGFDAVATEPLGIRHTHRAWTALERDPDERERQSRKNFNRFLERFRGRTDLIG